MTSIFSTALMGLFLLSSVGTITVPATPWTQDSHYAPTYETYTVGMTGYNATLEQTDETPGITASGTAPIPGVTAARSVDLSDELPFGTVIELVQNSATSTSTPTSMSTCGLGIVGDTIGYRVITDSMHSRKRNQIDILFDTDFGGKKPNPALTLGMCTGVTIRVVGHIDMAHIPSSQKELQLRIGRGMLALRS